jgi:hypothetical protein
MFNFVGSQAFSGFLSGADSFLKGLTPQSISGYVSKLPVLAQIEGLSGDIKAGYDAMSPDQKATFWKDLMIAGAALAAKAA